MLPGIKRTVNFADVMLYVTLAMKHRRLIVLLMCFGLMTGLTYYVYAKPVYYARSLISYHTTERPLDAEKVYTEDYGLEENTVFQLQAPHIIGRTAVKLGLDPDPKELYGKHLEGIGVRFNSEHNLEVQVYAYDKKILSRWAETMLQEFLAYRDEKRFEYRNDLINSFSNEMTQVTSKLNQVLDSHFEFESTNARTQLLIELDQLKDVPRQLAVIMQRISAMDRVKNTIQNDPKMSTTAKLSLLSTFQRDDDLTTGKLISMENAALNQNVLGPGAHPDMTLPTPAQNSQIVVLPSMVNPSEKQWESLDRKRVELERQMDELGRTYLPAHPKMRAVAKELKGVNESLEAELQTAMQRFTIEYADTLDKKTSLEKKMPAYTEIAKRAEKYRQDYSLLQAGQLSWAQMYQSMARRLSELEFGASKERQQLQYQSIVELRDKIPISPNRLKLVAMSLVLGLVLATGIPFLIEFLDHTATTVEDVEVNFKIRGLGIVPLVEEGHLAATPVIDSQNESDRYLVEHFRVIRTNLLAAAGSAKPAQVIMVASAVPQEGKTVISTNLAIAFAQMGEKTLLIDADLRRGRLHRVFGLKSTPGLSDVLMGNSDLQTTCQPTGRAGLTIMPCGKHATGATEFLGVSGFATLVEKLRHEYDRIIVDTPPVLGLSETAMMQSMVDGVVFVIWSGRTPMRSVKAAVQTLQTNHANFYGFVLNRLDLSSSPYYYYYYYYSHKYYGAYQSAEHS